MSHLLTHVTNTVTNQVTTFDSYLFNSMVKFGDTYFGASASGLFVLDDKASTEAVTANITTALLHFGNDQLKRVTDFFLSVRSAGNITLRATADEGLTQYDYTFNPTTDDLRQIRTWIGKGLRGKYWQFEIETTAAFDFDSWIVTAAFTNRRV